MRRLGQRILLGIAVTVVLAVALVLAIAIVRVTVGSEELARQLGDVASKELVDPATTRVRIGDLSGNPLTGIELHDVRVEVRSNRGQAAEADEAEDAGEGDDLEGGAGEAGHQRQVTGGDEEWLPFLIARAIRLDYKLTELSRVGPRLRSIRVVEPTVLLPAAGGRWPALKSRSPRGGAGSAFALNVDRLDLEQGSLVRDSTEVSLALGARLEIGRGYVTLAIDSLRTQATGHPEFFASGQTEVRGSAVYLDNFEVQTGESHLVLTGALDGTRGATLRIAFDPLALADARQASGSELLARPGWVRGTATIEGAWNDLTLGVALRAEIGEDSIDSLTARGRITTEAAEIERMALVLNGVPFSGSGRFGRRAAGGSSYGTLAFDAVDLSDLPFLRDQGWMPGGNLSGTVTVSAESRGPEGRRRPFDLRVTRGVVGGFVLAPGHFRGDLTPQGVIHLDEYAVTTRGAVITGSGEIDPRGELELGQELVISDLLALGGMVGERRFAGRGRAHLELTGPVSAPNFAVTGYFDSLAASVADLRGAAVQMSNGTIRPRFTFDVGVVSRGGTLAGQPLDRLSLAATYESGRVGIRTFTMGRGEAGLAAAGDVHFRRDAVIFDLSRLSARLGEERWVSSGPIRVGRHQSVWTIEEFSLSGASGSVAASGIIDPAGQVTDMELEVRSLALADIAAMRGVSELSGRMDLDLRARGGGAGAGLAIGFRTSVDSLAWKRLLAERIELEGNLDPTALTLNRILFERGGAVNANGLVRFADSLAGFAGLEALTRRATWDDSEIEFSARGSDIDLVAWHGLHGHLDWLWGSADIAVDLTGSPGAPDGTLSLVSSQFALGTEELGPVDARGHLEGGWLRIDEGRLTFDEQPLTARGLTPIHLQLLDVPALDREAPIALSFDLSGASLALARRVTGRVADAEGDLEGMITISGSLVRPLLDGAVRVNGGRIVVTGREEIFTRLNGELTMDGETVRFADVTATDGEKGRLRASGVLEVRGGKLTGYDATIELERYEVRSAGEYQGTVDATFTFRRGGPAGVGGLPDYSGSVVVHRLDYLREVVGRGGESEPGPSSWVGRFDIELPRNVWIRNTDLQVELKGELTYERDVSGRIILGQLETVRGRYDLFGHTFRITQGEILFTDPVELDPEINVTAETRIPEARIFATITGRASDRQVLLTSDPDYDPATIWRLLVPSDPGEVTNLVALTPLVQEIERALSQEIPGLSLRVEQRIQEGGTDATLGARVGTYVSPDVFVSAYQGFSSGSEQDVSVEYELSDLFFLKGSVVRTGVVEGQGGEDVQEEYNIDLNMRWEF